MSVSKGADPFTVEDRTHVREWMIQLARRDKRIIGGALTGSAAVGKEDRWSDVDLGFGIGGGAKPETVLADWMPLIRAEFGLLHYFDLQVGAGLFRVFLLASGLELDIGFWPGSNFGPTGEKFRLVFGRIVHNIPSTMPPTAEHLIGRCWHHALHARAAINRNRPWEAEYYISALRDHSLELACLRFGLPAIYARGTDELPREVTASYENALVRSLDSSDLRRALAGASRLFVDEVERADPALATSLRKVLLV